MIEVRLLERIVQTDTSCWIWQGSGVRYGALRVDGRMRLAHRVSYETFVGPIPDGLELDHLCRTPKCINPAHLEAVEGAENNRRSTSPTALNAAKTHCPKGHPYAGDNLVIKTNGRRRCLACHRASVVASHRRARAGGKA